jgi:hypothetical protein
MPSLCNRYSFNLSQPSLNVFNAALGIFFNGSIAGAENSSGMASVYCSVVAAGTVTECMGICANSDISGIGVRIGNYLQCFFNGIPLNLLK